MNEFFFSLEDNAISLIIIREVGDKVTDRLADYGATHIGSIWWDSIPDFAAETYARDLASSVYLRRA